MKDNGAKGQEVSPRPIHIFIGGTKGQESHPHRNWKVCEG